MSMRDFERQIIPRWIKEKVYTLNGSEIRIIIHYLPYRNVCFVCVFKQRGQACSGIYYFDELSDAEIAYSKLCNEYSKIGGISEVREQINDK